MRNELYRFLAKKYRKTFQRLGEKRLVIGYLPFPVVVNSIPKSGTNLLKNIVMALPNARHINDFSLAATKDDPLERLEFVTDRVSDLSPGCVYTGHVPYSQEIANWLRQHALKQVFIYRDPRDLTVSLYHYIMLDRESKHAYYELYAGLGSDAARLMGTIRGVGEGKTKFKASIHSIPNIRLVFDANEKWLSDDNTFAVRYEDLVDSQESCIATTEKMLDFLGVRFDKQFIDDILRLGKDPGKSHTFRQGRSGSWRAEYSQQHIDAFREVAGDLLDRWGYSWD
jgi:hypothetical protein